MKIAQLTLPKNDFFAELSRDNYNLLYKASRVASARVKPFAYDRFRQERVQTKKPELRIAGAKPFCKAIKEFVEKKIRKW